MKSIVISSNSSGGGKTTIAVGIMKALIKKGFDVQGYKVGPDYIDGAFHSQITKKPSRNLDVYLMGEGGVKASYSRGKGDLGVVEGVMGLYDGKGIDSKYSTAHVAKTLGLPVVLVLSPKAQSATLCAEINGLINFDEVKIGGIILNNISESYYNLLKSAIEYNCNVNVLGYIPKDQRLKIESRHLGLIQSSEIEDLEEKVDICSEYILKNIDLDKLLKIFKETPKYEDRFHLENKDLKIAVAYDKAFSFYYRDNIDFLEELGDITYFSPLKDKEIPKDLDFLYIGGGYPEVFIEELSKNKSMLKSIKKELDKGLKCYAECGGLMYLTEAIENEDLKGNTVGYFKGSSKMTKRLQNFGYAQLEVYKENEIIPKGLNINCHEFHKSIVELDEKRIFKINKTMYNGEKKHWNCGYIKGNTIATYAHVNFLGNVEFLKALLKNKTTSERRY